MSLTIRGASTLLLVAIFNIFLISKILGVGQCKLAGVESGECVDALSVESKISFCGEYLPKFVCVPYNQVQKYTKFVKVLWGNDFSIEQKDAKIEEIFIRNIQRRLIFEYEYATSSLTNDLTRKSNCYQAYKKFLCRWNFPLCSSNFFRKKFQKKNYFFHWVNSNKKKKKKFGRIRMTRVILK